MQQNQAKIENTVALRGVSRKRTPMHFSVYEEFIRWSAMTAPDQRKTGITNQKEFAERYGVGERTVSRWRGLPEYKAAVREIRNRWGFDRTSDVIEAIYRTALAGDARAQLRPPMFTLNSEMKKMAETLPMDSEYLSLLVRGYVLYDRFFYDELEGLKKYDFHTTNVCTIEDAQREFEEHVPSDDLDDPFYIRQYTHMLENELWKYPIVVRVHPHASQRDIIEYIKAHWKEIASYQKRYAGIARNASFKNSKTRISENRIKRYKFIYENRTLPRKIIMQKVHDQFGVTLDPGSIGKIISLEKKRREKK